MTDSGELDIRMQRTNTHTPNCQIEFTSSSAPGALLRADLEERHASLASVIAGDIVPRLQMMHQTHLGRDAEAAFSSDEIEEFGVLLVHADGARSAAFFQKMRDKGHSLETLFVGLLSEAARHLGALWEQDRCDFVEVTLGVTRLQKLLCHFGGVDEPAMPDRRQRAMLTALPGENHVFGLAMVAVFMRNASWEVAVQTGLDTDGLADCVAQEWFGIVGITLSAESALERLARTIHIMRDASANPNVGVLVGGPLFRRCPDLVAQVGADAMAPDAPTATILAKKLILRQAGGQPKKFVADHFQ